MTTIELKEHLITGHKRDKKLSIIGVFLILIAAIIIISLLYFFAYDIVANAIKGISSGASEMASSDETPFYYKLVIPIVILSMLWYPVYKIIILAKRPKRIDELITKIESGLIAASVDQSTVYKIIIPLIKINFKLAPVEYVSIVLDGDTSYKPFSLPIAEHLIPDLKKVLSGVDLQRIDKAWYDLYGGSIDTGDAKEVQELKSNEEFKQFVETDLKNDIKALEGERSKGKAVYIKYAVFTVVFCVLFYGGFFYLQSTDVEFKQEYIIYGFIGVSLLIYAFVFINNMLNKKKPLTMNSNGFKMKILKPMIEFVNPNFQFILHGHITLPELLEAGLLEDKKYKLQGNDQIIGAHKGVPFQLSDLGVAYKRNFSNAKEGPDTVFYGQVFIAKFNKSFNSEVYLVPKKTVRRKVANAVIPDVVGANLAGARTTDIGMYTSNKFGTKVILEDPEFTKLYDVYCNDQTEARYILTPALMERLKALNTRTTGDLFISFRNDRVSVFNNNGKNNFEAGLFKSMIKNDYKMLMDFYTDLCDQLLIIDDLKLNINIWNKN